jgi:hypothetical protein
VPQNPGRNKKKIVTLVKRTHKSKQVRFHRGENAYKERIDTSSTGTEPKYNPETNGKEKSSNPKRKGEKF